MTTRRHDSVRCQALIRAFLLSLFILGCAVPAHGQSLPERAKARGDSILAVAKCWRFAKAPATPVSTSSCPDSVEATTKMLPAAPVMHLDRVGGVHFHLQVGQTLQLQATLLRGFLFIWPAGVPFRGASVQTIPVAPPDAVRRVI
jgi:hypothetical protein